MMFFYNILGILETIKRKMIKMKNDKIKIAYEEIMNEKNNSINEELKIKFNELCTYLS